MINISPERTNVSSSSHLYSFDDDDDYEEKNDKILKLKFIFFFIFIFFILVIFLSFVLILIYYTIIKQETKFSKIKPETVLSMKEIMKIEQYVNDCMNGVLINKYPKSENPKISLVIPVYNKEKFIIRILRSIQNQSFKNIEIIFCDDYSYDNSSLLIEEYQKEDKRIVLIKHEKNVGTFRNRIDGVKIAKGEYIIFIDPDDLLLNDILKRVNSVVSSTNIDILQFQLYIGDFYNSFYILNINRTSAPIYQPQLSDLMYYEKGYLQQTECHIWGKAYKKEILMKAINSLNEYYLNQHMSLHEDGLFLFLIFRKANSYLFIKDYGMLYYSNEYSTMKNLRKKTKINKTARDSFLYLEFMFDYTNNTLHEKNMAVYQFKSLQNLFGDTYLEITDGYDYIFKVIDLYLNCDIILEKDKKEIKQLKEKILSVQKNIYNNI